MLVAGHDEDEPPMAGTKLSSGCARSLCDPADLLLVNPDNMATTEEGFPAIIDVRLLGMDYLQLTLPPRNPSWRTRMGDRGPTSTAL